MKCILYKLVDNSVAIGMIQHKSGLFTAPLQKLIDDGMSEIDVISLEANNSLKRYPTGTTFRIIDSTELPSGTKSGNFDKTFRDAFVDTGKLNIDNIKAKEITHEFRRSKRTKDFEPLDKLVIIPSEADEAEEKRQKIRIADAKLQKTIDNTKTPKALKTILVNNNLV